MQHAIHWFEIPVADLSRATAFYSRILGIASFRSEQAGETKMAIFPHDRATNGVGGALLWNGKARPASAGVTVYLNAGTDIRGAIDRVIDAGGRVTRPVTDIGDPGYIALIEDTEGNIVGLHQPRAATSNGDRIA